MPSRPYRLGQAAKYSPAYQLCLSMIVTWSGSLGSCMIAVDAYMPAMIGKCNTMSSIAAAAARILSSIDGRRYALPTNMGPHSQLGENDRIMCLSHR